MIKASELRELNIGELRQKELDSQENLFNLRIQNSLAQLENPSKIRQARREIAIIKTVIREKELQESKNSEQKDRES
jgi:large subunit ribosomal protein L29